MTFRTKNEAVQIIMDKCIAKGLSNAQIELVLEISCVYNNPYQGDYPDIYNALHPQLENSGQANQTTIEKSETVTVLLEALLGMKRNDADIIDNIPLREDGIHKAWVISQLGLEKQSSKKTKQHLDLLRGISPNSVRMIRMVRSTIWFLLKVFS